MYTGNLVVDEVLEEFAAGIDDLVKMHGEEEIEEILNQRIPGLAEAFMAEAVLAEGLKLPKPKPKPKKTKGKGKKKNKGDKDGGGTLGDRAADAIGTVGGAVGSAAGGIISAAGRFFGKDIDQDVNIADQEIDLRVVNPALEDLVAQTNKILTTLTDALTGGIDNLDLSIDNLIAAETGESLASIQGRQATGATASAQPEEGEDFIDIEPEEEEPPPRVKRPAGPGKK